MKTKKSLRKRLKITARGKILRRHQLGAGHLNRQKKTAVYFKGEARRLRKVIGL